MANKILRKTVGGYDLYAMVAKFDDTCREIAPNLLPSRTYRDGEILMDNGDYPVWSADVINTYTIHEPDGPIQSVEIGGKTYNVVQIDNLYWFVENLDYAWQGLTILTSGTSASSSPQATYYNNDENTYGWNGLKYGLQYNWHAVNYLETNKASLLPEGWRIPTISDWQNLATYVGGISVAGTKLKATNVETSPNWGGTDEYGLALMPSGGSSISFFDINEGAYLWSSTESEYYTTDAFSVSVFSDESEMYITEDDGKYYQYSLRLVKDVT